jgi:hypothetical protein
MENRGKKMGIGRKIFLLLKIMRKELEVFCLFAL